jgi:hypothetical protein
MTYKWYLNGILKNTDASTQTGPVVDSHNGSISLGINGSGLLFPLSIQDIDWNNDTYVDGFDEYVRDGNIDNTDYNLYYYTGNIALFRIWNVARTVDQINDNKSTLLELGVQLVAYLYEDTIFYEPNNENSFSSLSLNGEISYFRITNTELDEETVIENRTIEFRFKANDIDTKQVLYEQGGNVHALFIFIEDGRLYLGAYRDNASSAANRRFFRSGATQISVNQEYHVALTLSGGNNILKWFLDGQEQDSQSGFILPSQGDINLGRSGGSLRYPDLISGWSPGTGTGTNPSETSTTVNPVLDNNENVFLGDFSLFRTWSGVRNVNQIDDNKSTFLTSGAGLVAYQVGNKVFYDSNTDDSFDENEVVFPVFSDDDIIFFMEWKYLWQLG